MISCKSCLAHKMSHAKSITLPFAQTRDLDDSIKNESGMVKPCRDDVKIYSHPLTKYNACVPSSVVTVVLGYVLS